MLSSSCLHIKIMQDFKTCIINRINDVFKVLQISSSIVIISDINYLIIINLFNISKLHITLIKTKTLFIRMNMKISIKQIKLNLTILIRKTHLMTTDTIVRKHKHILNKKKLNKNITVAMKTTSCLLIYILL